ncbi:MAG: ATP-binding protein [Saezia sp.]
MMKSIEPTQRSVEKGLRWVSALFLCAAIVLIVALVFILVQTTGTQDLYTPYFKWLLAINVGITLLLLVSLIWAIVRIATRLKQRRFGSRLLAKLALIFGLVGVLPGVLVYAISYQFVSKSIETWFDVKVDGALSAGLKLADVSFDAQVQDLANKTQILATQFAQVPDAQVGIQLERVRQQAEIDDLLLSTMEGEVISAAGFASYQLAVERLSLSQRTELVQKGVIFGLERNEEGLSPRMWAVSIVPANIYDVTGKVRLLRLSTQVPRELSRNADLVQEAYKEYQEKALGRESLRRMYIGTLTLALFLAIFGAIALAVMLGQQLIRPLLILVEGVKQVGEGDLSPKELMDTHDELGGLTHAFAKMTSQLREANQIASQSMKQVEDAHTHLQTVLDNLTTGVIELDRENYIQMINPGARRIFRANLESWKKQKLKDIVTLKAFSARADECFAILPDDGSRHWQETFELENLHDDDKITIVARGVWLSGFVKLIVIEDISDIISAQRSIAWGEVARRLAHEIKNPLTPIQLSAERMKYKLADKLQGQDRSVLERSVKMIVDQVDAMKRLVNEFRDYARLPVAELETLDLNTVVRDIMQLYLGEQGQNQKLKINVNLALDVPLIKGDASQLRQVLHNLMQNAIDAVSSQNVQIVTVRTEYQNMQNNAEQSGRVCLWVSDTGEGFSEKILKRVFEPYITTKPQGTGLGLAVVRKIMDEHGGRIDISNQTNNEGQVIGAQVLLSFPVAMITQTLEK